MILPEFALSSLPGFGAVAGLFDHLGHAMRIAASDDTIIILMAFLYEILPPTGHP